MRELNKDDGFLADSLSGYVNTTEGVIIKDGNLKTYAFFMGDYQLIYDLLCGIEELKDGDFEVIKVKHGVRM